MATLGLAAASGDRLGPFAAAMHAFELHVSVLPTWSVQALNKTDGNTWITTADAHRHPDSASAHAWAHATTCRLSTHPQD